MMRHIYALPLHMVIILMLALLIVWAMLSLHKNQKKRTIINLVLCSITALTILYATILTRTPGDYKPILTPFATFTDALHPTEALPRDADEHISLLPSWLNALQCPAAKVAPLGQNRPHNACRLRAQRRNRVYPVPLRSRHGGGG